MVFYKNIPWLMGQVLYNIILAVINTNKTKVIKQIKK